MNVILSGTGIYRPEDVVTNEELVKTFNEYVDLYNEQNKAAIEKKQLEPLLYSDSEFIEKASGIKSRYVIDKKGILDPRVMHPVIPERSDNELSLQAEMALKAAKIALEDANIAHRDIDAVIVACSNMQRAYPAMAIEVQQALDIQGFAFDMNVACSSATFGLQMAESLIKSNSARSVLVLSPEICSAHLNFRDRDSHFIFGDVASAMIVQSVDAVKTDKAFKIVSSQLTTQFSNNIRNNRGFMNRLTEGASELSDKLFYQNGRKVFKEVTAKVVQHVLQQLEQLNMPITDLSRLWLHQANLNMNRLIATKLMGREVAIEEAPVVLDTYANTSSAGSVVAFHQNHKDLVPGQKGLLCSFGAGYSIGSIILERLSL